MNTLTALGIKHVRDLFSGNRDSVSICLETHEEVISRLKFIAHIQKDEKINVRHVNRQPNTLYTKISRSLIYPDNRNNSLKFVKDVISRSLEILHHYILKENFNLSKGILNDLLKARQGIINLKYTYNDDTKFCCDMDVVIENIGVFIDKLEKEHPILFRETENNESNENSNEK